jgi:hypothetical protein
MTAGRRRADRARARARRTVGLLLGTLVGAAAWWFLVRAAVDFGRAAIAGEGHGRWAFTVVAGGGAALCLMLVLVLLSRIWEDHVRKGVAGGRRRR